MADLKLSILMEARDKLTANFQKARTATGNLRTSLDGTAKKLRDLESAAKKLASYRRLRADSKATAAQLAAAKEKAERLGKAPLARVPPPPGGHSRNSTAPGAPSAA